jgi:hypothetical protein
MVEVELLKLELTFAPLLRVALRNAEFPMYPGDSLTLSELFVQESGFFLTPQSIR